LHPLPSLATLLPMLISGSYLLARSLLWISLLLPMAVAAADSREGNWDDRFHHPLRFSGIIEDLAYGDGKLYAVGQFQEAGGVGATNLAQWNGTNWSAIGEALGGHPIQLALNGSNLYVRGFRLWPGPNNSQIGRWDGREWRQVETDFFTALDMVSYEDGVCIAGSRFDGETWNRVIVYLDGTNTTTIASLAGGHFTSLAARGRELFVGGDFNSINSVAAANIARWDGTNWFDAGSGLTHWWHFDLAADDQWLYVAGNFTQIGGQAITNIARWDGTNWFALPGLLEPVGGLWSLETAGGDLYVSGGFASGPDRAWGSIAKWDGNTWTIMPSDGLVDKATFAIDGRNGVYVGGRFSRLGEAPANGVAYLNGTNFSNLSGGVLGPGVTLAVTRYGTDVVVGGGFHSIGGVAITNLARWNGTQWLPIGQAPDGEVTYLFAHEQMLYVRGRFTRIGGIEARRMARFDGSHWMAMAEEKEFHPEVLAAQGTNLFALGAPYEGAFLFRGDQVRRWTGQKWQPILTTNSQWNFMPSGLAATPSKLYVSGYFTRVDDPNPGDYEGREYVLQWEGTDWSPVSGAPETWAPRIMADGELLYMSAYAGAGDSLSLAIWDGASWSETDGIPLTWPQVWSMATAGGNIYVHNRFGHSHLLRWDGLGWSDLGKDLDGIVHAVAEYGSDLLVAGEFTEAGGKPSYGIAIWHEPTEVRIQIEAQGTNAIISWPAALGNFSLEEAPRLSPADWTAVKRSPAVVGGRLVLTNTTLLPNDPSALKDGFYRLRRR
jgi:trimeric autotransporter adhesin